MSQLRSPPASADLRPDLPVVLATGYSHAVETGAGGRFTIIQKPYTAAKIAEAARAAKGAAARI